MKFRTLVLSSACLVTALATAARAELISSFTDSISANSSTQQGRPSRNNATPQTWADTETYPGLLPGSQANTYLYKTYTFAPSLFTGAPYVEITFFDVFDSTDIFASAYSGSYDPANQSKNWLGDEAYGGNYIPNNSNAFDVILPTGSPLVLVVNTTSPGLGIGDPFQVTISGYSDTNYDPPTTVTPEPSSLLLLGSGLLSAVGLLRHRLR